MTVSIVPEKPKEMKVKTVLLNHFDLIFGLMKY